MLNKILRSFVIPVLDFSKHSQYNIYTLLDDLEQIEGEVICIFNNQDVFEKLKDHRRINKFCYNKLNAGVSRSWNMGIELSEGDLIYIMNSDLHIKSEAVKKLENYTLTLEKAVIVGPQGTHINFKNLGIIKYFQKGMFNQPMKTHDISGFLFCIHSERFLGNGLKFDSRFTPCFFEEWDMGLQVLNKGLSLYAVPVTEFEHEWGVSQSMDDTVIEFLGKSMTKKEILIENRKKFLTKWAHLINA